MSDGRNRRPSLDDLRRVAQPPEVLGRRNAEHWASIAYMRRASLHVSRWAIGRGLSANQVTGLMVAAGVVGCVVAAVPGWISAVVAALLTQLYLLLDCSDGEVARWRGSESARGVYLDRLGHYVVEGGLMVAFGLRVGGWSEPSWLALGLAAAVGVLLTKAETDLVHVARHASGLPKLSDTEPAIGSKGLAAARSAVSRLRLHRITGAIEASLLIAGAAIADAATGGLTVSRVTLTVVTIVALAVSAGHAVTILGSNRLDPQ